MEENTTHVFSNLNIKKVNLANKIFSVEDYYLICTVLTDTVVILVNLAFLMFGPTFIYS